MIKLKEEKTLEWDFKNMSVVEANDIFMEISKFVDEDESLSTSKYFTFWKTVNVDKTEMDYVVNSFNSLIKNARLPK